jgi:hypothetical protein
VPGRVPAPAVTAIGPDPVQGSPVCAFLPNGGCSIAVLGAGETGNWGQLGHSISAQYRIGGISAQYRIGGISAPQRIASILCERNRKSCR